MPELPEVETVVRRLSELVTGKKIKDVEVRRDKSFSGSKQDIIGLPIKQITRRAKLIRFHLPDDLNLLSHLKMTGQFIYQDQQQRTGGGHPTADWVGELPSKHTRVVFDLSDNAKLFFNDMRVFGWVRVLSNQQVDSKLDRYGPDVIDEAVTTDYLVERFARTGRAIKQALMDNKIMAGVGNIYASDALNLAQISPAKPANQLSRDEIESLLAATKTVINRGIKSGGATIDNYTQVDGFSGGYQNQVLTYGREGEECKQCGGEIIKTKIGGRGSYYCNQCQLYK